MRPLAEILKLRRLYPDIFSYTYFFCRCDPSYANNPVESKIFVLLCSN